MNNHVQVHNKTGNVTQPNIEARSRNDCCHGKALISKYYDWASVFLIQLSGMHIASFLPCITGILSSVACLALPELFTLSHNKAAFSLKKFEHVICFDFL